MILHEGTQIDSGMQCSTEIGPYLFNQLIFNQGTKSQFNEDRKMFSTNDAGTIGYSYRGGRNELQLSHSNQKINLKWIIALM